MALIDADLQQRPDYIAQMLTFLEEHPEYDEVWPTRDGAMRAACWFCARGCFIRSSAAHRPALRRRRQRFPGVPAQRAGGDSLPSGAGPVFQGDLRLDRLPHLPDALPGGGAGQRRLQVEPGKLFGYAMEGITAFSTKLLLLPLIAGVILAVGAVLLAVVLKILSVAGALSVTGVGWLAMLLVFLAGVQLQGLGVAAFYLGKLFNEGKGRPVYIERVVLPGGGEGK